MAKYDAPKKTEDKEKDSPGEVAAPETAKTDFDEGMSLEEIKEALKEDIDAAVTHVQEQYVQNWDYLNNLYHNIRETDEYTEDWQANLGLSGAFGPVNQEIPSIMGGIFPKPDFYSLTPVDDDGSDKYAIAAEAHRSIMTKQAEQMHLYKNLYWTVMDALIFSAGWVKLEWKFDRKKRKYLDSRSGKLVQVTKEEIIAHPIITNISPYDVFVDPEATGVEDARYVVHKVQKTLGEIMSSKFWNMTDEKNQLKADVINGGNKRWKNCKVDLYLYYTPTEIMAVTTDYKFVVKKHTTPYKHNRIPLFNLVKFPEQRSPYGISTVEAIADMVEYTNILVNSNADNIRIALNKLFTLKSSSDIDGETLKVAPGRIFKIRQNDELKEMPITPVSPMVYREIGQMEQFKNQAIGNMDMIDSSQVKTAREAEIVASRASAKVKEFIVYNREEFLKPLIKTWIDLNQQYLTKQDDIVKVLGKTTIKKLELEGKEIDLNVDVMVQVSGDSGMAERGQVLEEVGQFIQLMATAAQLPPEVDRRKYLETLVGLMPNIPKDILLPANRQPKEEPMQPAAPPMPGGPEGAPPPQAGPPPAPGQGASPRDAIAQEIITLAQQTNMTPAQLVTALAQKLGMDPQAMIQAIEQAGSLNAFLAQTQGGAQSVTTG